jgi:hypothetical protein
MSDTPRTDAEGFYPDDACSEVVCADFARTLERELNAAKVEIERMRAVIKDSNAYLLDWRRRHDIKPRPEWLAAQAALKELK